MHNEKLSYVNNYELCIMNYELNINLIAKCHWSPNDREGAINRDKSEDLPLSIEISESPTG